MFAAPPTAANATVPYLVSFPRTGSHWLRMFLELYFDRPMLTRWFFEHDSTDYLLLHTHDKSDEIQDRRDTVYLYRSVVNTVFSEATFWHGEAAADLDWETVKGIADAYRASLRKWLLRDDVAARKHVIAYEWILDRPVETLSSVIEFLGGEADPERIDATLPVVDHGLVAEKSGYERRVMDRAADKQLRRDLFRYRFGRRVLDLFSIDADLASAMDPALLQ